MTALSCSSKCFLSNVLRTIRATFATSEGTDWRDFSTSWHRPLSCGAMLSLRRVKSFVFAQQASPRRKFSPRLAVCKYKAFYSPETQQGCQVTKVYCVVPENIHTHPNEGHWKFQGVSEDQIFKRKYEAELEFPEGGRVQSKKPSMGEVWIFSGTTYFHA